MFQQPMSELAIIIEMEGRQRLDPSEPESEESYRWFDQPKTMRPNWVWNALWHLGHLFVFIGHQLENGAVNLAATPNQQLKST